MEQPLLLNTPYLRDMRSGICWWEPQGKEPGLAPFIATSRLRWIAQVQKLASTTLPWQLRLKNGRAEQRMREQTDIGECRLLTNPGWEGLTRGTGSE